MRSQVVRMLLAAVVVLVSATVTLAAGPEHHHHTTFKGRFDRRHPRRDEVNSRLNRQQARISQGVRTGKLTPAQAGQLEANDRSIKQQERADVKANGGHLTAAEQRQLNQEENANSTLIRDDKNPAPK